MSFQDVMLFLIMAAVGSVSLVAFYQSAPVPPIAHVNLESEDGAILEFTLDPETRRVRSAVVTSDSYTLIPESIERDSANDFESSSDDVYIRRTPEELQIRLRGCLLFDLADNTLVIND
jgi:hypothetical protein